jgi:hypothetical protein
MVKFRIRGRSRWGAAPATSVSPQKPGGVHTIVVHHTVGGRPLTVVGAKRELQSMQRHHMRSQGWSDIGYNFIIDGFGRVWEGRGAYRVGAHTLGRNTGTIGVAFMGNYEKVELSDRQIAAFNNLLERLKLFGVRASRVRGHKQMPGQATACPGRNIMRQLNLG